MLGSYNIIGTDDGIIIRSTTLGDTDINTIGIDEGTDLGSPDGFLDGSNEGKSVGLLFGEAFGLYDRTVLGSSDGALDAAKDVMLEEYRAKDSMLEG